MQSNCAASVLHVRTSGIWTSHSADAKRGAPPATNDLAKQGQQGNTKVNTTHQGYQQAGKEPSHVDISKEPVEHPPGAVRAQVTRMPRRRST